MFKISLGVRLMFDISIELSTKKQSEMVAFFCFKLKYIRGLRHPLLCVLFNFINSLTWVNNHKCIENVLIIGKNWQ